MGKNKGGAGRRPRRMSYVAPPETAAAEQSEPSALERRLREVVEEPTAEASCERSAELPVCGPVAAGWPDAPEACRGGTQPCESPASEPAASSSGEGNGEPPREASSSAAAAEAELAVERQQQLEQQLARRQTRTACAELLHRFDRQLWDAELLFAKLLQGDGGRLLRQPASGSATQACTPPHRAPHTWASAAASPDGSTTFRGSSLQAVQEARRSMERAVQQTEQATAATSLANQKSRSASPCDESGHRTARGQRPGSTAQQAAACPASGRPQSSTSPAGPHAQVTPQPAPRRLLGTPFEQLSLLPPGTAAGPLAAEDSPSGSDHSRLGAAGSPLPRSPLCITAAAALSELRVNSPTLDRHRRSASSGDPDKSPPSALARVPSFAFSLGSPGLTAAGGGVSAPASAAQENMQQLLHSATAAAKGVGARGVRPSFKLSLEAIAR